MRTVYNYTGLLKNDKCIMKMPDQAKIVDVHLSDDDAYLTIWAEVWTNEPLCDIEFIIVGTGWELPNDYRWWHVRTVQQQTFVWHIYRRNP
jgi:hypothetical protein